MRKFTVARLYPFKEGEKDMVGGPSIVFTRKAVCGKIFIRKSTSLCKLLIGTNASQLYPFQCVRLCQQNVTRVGNLAHLNSDRTSPKDFKIWSCATSDAWHPFVKLKPLLHKPDRKKLTASVLVYGFCFHCKTDFRAIWCFHHFCLCQEIRPSLTEADIKRDIEKRELDELGRNYEKQKCFAFTEMWECDWWRLQNWHPALKNIYGKKFLPDVHLQKINSWKK